MLHLLVVLLIVYVLVQCGETCCDHLQLNANTLVEEGDGGVLATVTEEKEGAGASGIQTCTRLIRNVACDGALVSQLVDKRTLQILSDFATQDTCTCALCL